MTMTLDPFDPATWSGTERAYFERVDQAIEQQANLLFSNGLPEADLRDRPDSFGLVGHLWDGPLLREHLRRRYGVKLGVRQCQRLFHRMGFRLRKPRPQVAGAADPERSEAFKKTAPSGRA